MKKKGVITLIIIAVWLVLCGAVVAFGYFCMPWDPGEYNFNSEDLADVVSIELINYENPEQKDFNSWVPDHTSDLKPFDASKMSRLENLEEGKTADFIENLCEYHILYKFFAYDSPNGLCIKLNYSNGDFIIICGESPHTTYVAKFSSDGEVADFIGIFESFNDYKVLVNTYFQTQI